MGNDDEGKESIATDTEQDKQEIDEIGEPEESEATNTEIEPAWEPEITPEVALLFDQWRIDPNAAQNNLFITFRVKSLHVTADVKFGPYSTYEGRSHEQFEPVTPLYWSTLIQNADEEIRSSGTDVILGMVVEQAVRNAVFRLHNIRMLFEKDVFTEAEIQRAEAAQGIKTASKQITKLAQDKVEEF